MKNVIEININTYEDITEKFNNDKLSRELANFIYDQYAALSLNKNVEINIKSTCDLTEEQENNIADMIHRHFGLETQKSILIFKYKTKYQILLFLIGIFLITLSNLKFISELSTIHEILLIFGWVAVWELIYDIMFVDIKENVKRKKYKKLSKVKINYLK